MQEALELCKLAVTPQHLTVKLCAAQAHCQIYVKKSIWDQNKQLLRAIAPGGAMHSHATPDAEELTGVSAAVKLRCGTFLKLLTHLITTEERGRHSGCSSTLMYSPSATYKASDADKAGRLDPHVALLLACGQDDQGRTTQSR